MSDIAPQPPVAEPAPTAPQPRADVATIRAEIAFTSLEARMVELSSRLETARHWGMGAATGLAAIAVSSAFIVWQLHAGKFDDLQRQEHASQLTLVEIKTQLTYLNDQMKEENARDQRTSMLVGNIAAKLDATEAEGGPYQPAQRPRHHRRR